MDRKKQQMFLTEEIAEMFRQPRQNEPDLKDGLEDTLEKAKNGRSSDALSQEEIDRLLKALSEGEREDGSVRIKGLKKDLKLINAYVQGWNDAIDRVVEVGRE